jgi:two-component system, NarL family, response regulator DevR
VENRTNVLVLCCNRLLRESITRILNKKTDFQVIVSQNSAPGSPPDVAESKADVVVLDSLQPLSEGSLSGSNQPDGWKMKCVLVAMEDDPKCFLTAIRLGALGYVLQEASAVEVVTAIRAVAKGEAVCPSRYVRILFDYFVSRTTASPTSRTRAQTGLTRREQQLIPLIERGMTNKEIASQLNLSEQTVKNHIHRILRKVGVEDRLSVFEAFQAQAMGL